MTLALAGCTQISFQSKGLIPVYSSQRPDHQNIVTLKGTKEFYLWGLIGPDDKVYLDEELYDQGLVVASNITIQEYQEVSSFLKAFFSLGFYIPKNYKVTAHGLEANDD